MTKQEKKLVDKIIKTYEKIIHGDKGHTGLFDCYDTYYKGCWDNDLDEIDKLRQKLTKLKLL